jgi:hypothetical protein
MIYDPYSGEQLRALRALPRHHAVEVSASAIPRFRWADTAVVLACIAAWLIAQVFG